MLAGHRHRPSRQRQHQAVLLEQRNEGFGRDGAALPMMPAHQRFEAQQLALPAHEWLVVKRD